MMGDEGIHMGLAQQTKDYAELWESLKFQIVLDLGFFQIIWEPEILIEYLW